MKLSIVATLYKSSTYVEEFHARVSKAASGITNDYEIVLVNDGSPDDSLAKAIALSQSDSHVAVVDLSRNFGHHKAMMTGLMHTKGEYVFLIDVDLEEAPENLTRFWDYMHSTQDVDVVIGQTAVKQGSFLKCLMSSWFYLLFNALSSIKISNREMVSRLMRRCYVDALIAYRERELFIPGVWAHAGFSQHYLASEKVFDGSSSYTLGRKFTMAVDAITSFSTRPLMLIFYTGCTFSVGSVLVVIYLTINKFVYGGVFQGWSSLVAIMFFIGGIVIFSLGVVGVYVSKIYAEVKQRPYTIVKQIFQQK